MILTWLGVFFIYFVMDILYVYYTLKITERKAFQSATFASIIYLLSACGILTYVNNPVYLTAVFLGSFFGTYCGIVIENLKKVVDK